MWVTRVTDKVGRMRCFGFPNSFIFICNRTKWRVIPWRSMGVFTCRRLEDWAVKSASSLGALTHGPSTSTPWLSHSVGSSSSPSGPTISDIDPGFLTNLIWAHYHRDGLKLMRMRSTQTRVCHQMWWLSNLMCRVWASTSTGYDSHYIIISLSD